MIFFLNQQTLTAILGLQQNWVENTEFLYVPLPTQAQAPPVLTPYSKTANLLK